MEESQARPSSICKRPKLLLHTFLFHKAAAATGAWAQGQTAFEAEALLFSRMFFRKCQRSWTTCSSGQTSLAAFRLPSK